MKGLVNGMEKDKKVMANGRTHSLTQKISLNSQLDTVAFQYMNVGGAPVKHETSMSPHKESI